MEKIVLITGATGGIGFATSKAFGREGYRVLLADIDDSRAEACMAELKSLAVPCEYYHIDVTSEAVVNEQITRIAATYDHLDAVVNNAGGPGWTFPFRGYDDRLLSQRAGFES